MNLLIGALLNGVTYGMLYGLLGFAIVLLYKATGIANFAQGNLGAFGAFVIYAFAVTRGVPLPSALLAGFVAAAAAGGASYLAVIRPRESDHLNATMRTIGLFMLIFAVVNYYWAQGQPFNFPDIFPDSTAFTVAGNNVSWLTVGTLLVSASLAGFFAIGFRHTDLGLLYLGLASRPDVAKLLGVRVQLLTFVAWSASAVVSLIVACLIAPVSFLSTDMMDLFLLYAFTAAVVGGLTSLVGVFIGGLMVGLLDNLMTVYYNGDAATLAVFALLLGVLLARPQGLLGTSTRERF